MEGVDLMDSPLLDLAMMWTNRKNRDKVQAVRLMWPELSTQVQALLYQMDYEGDWHDLQFHSAGQDS